MEIVKTVPPKETKSKKYMFVCKTCKKEENGFNYSKTTFVADYPNDFFSCVSPREYCNCPVYGALHGRSIVARLRYIWYEHKNKG
jgi:hypothetical protein